jgi:hypothetical protein
MWEQPANFPHLPALIDKSTPRSVLSTYIKEAAATARTSLRSAVSPASVARSALLTMQTTGV